MAEIEDLKKEFGEAAEYKRKPKSAPEPKESKIEKTANAVKKSKKLKRIKRKVSKTVGSVLEDKTLGKIFNLYFICFVIHILEYAIIINYFQLNTRGFIGNFCSLFIVFFYLYGMRLKPQNIGFNLNKKHIKRSLKAALLFNLTALPVLVAELLLYWANDTEIIVRFFAYNMSYRVAGSAIKFLFYIAYMFLVSFVSALMLESLFRGVLLKTGKAKFGFWQTSVMLSVLYSVWFLVIPLTKLFTGYVSLVDLLGLCIFYAVYEFIVAIKWSMLTRASGSLWLAFFDHLLFTFLMNFYHVINQTQGCAIPLDQYKQTRLLAIQIVSCAVAVVYYILKMKNKKLAAEKSGHRSSGYIDSLADLTEEEISSKLQRTVVKTEDGEVDAEYLKLLEKRKQEENAGNAHS